MGRLSGIYLFTISAWTVVALDFLFLFAVRTLSLYIEWLRCASSPCTCKLFLKAYTRHKKKKKKKKKKTEFGL